jgi:glycine/D-amino acid oxidase-like deaminating enzyme
MDMEFDVVVVGSGAGAMTAAVVAAHAGVKVLVAEKARWFGGTSALSGGVAWVPDNPHIPETGQADSRERAFRYFESLVGPQRMRPQVMQSFFENGRRMVEFLEANTQVQFQATTYPDYKAHLDGGMPVGRSISAREYDGKLLGEHLARLRPPMPELCVLGRMMVDGVDVFHLMNMTRSFTSLIHVTRRFFPFVRDLLRHGRGARLVMGNALIGRLLRSALDVGVTLWTDAPVRELVMEGGRVAAVILVRDGVTQRIRVRRGVVRFLDCTPVVATCIRSLRDLIRVVVARSDLEWYSVMLPAAVSQGLSRAPFALPPMAPDRGREPGADAGLQ